MARFRHVEVVEVRIWDATVGAAAYDPVAGAFVFEYDPAWARQGVELAPFMMPVGGAGSFVFPTLARETYMGLPGLLSDALPDRFGNQLIDAWMANKGYRPEQITALDRLAYMGKRGVGALEFLPRRGNLRAGENINVTLVLRGATEGSGAHGRVRIPAVALVYWQGVPGTGSTR